MPLSDTEIAERTRKALDVPLLRFLGASVVELDDSGDSLRLRVEPELLNAVGALHGGAIATLLDVAAYLAVLRELESDEEAVTHGFAASYIAGAERGDRLRVAGSVRRRTGRLAFVTSELHSADRLLAAAQVTKSIVKSQP